ncbi:uncharacterized protein LOC134823669 [Bolinopsis microptera]|uniref:uncharacterized protein LOC134823669 n=1 Tax=Bolinopsis microptera TaxID=2820187 RepID=UPI003078C3E6
MGLRVYLVLSGYLLGLAAPIFKGKDHNGKESNEIEDWEFTRQQGCKTYSSNIKHMSCECLEHFSAHNNCENYVDFKDLRSLPRCRKLESCPSHDMRCHCRRNFCAIRGRCYVLWRSILSMKRVDYLLQWLAKCNTFGVNDTSNDAVP